MQNKAPYEYAVIRLVPKVEREEFINIGVLLFSKRKKYLGIKLNLDEERILAFSKEVDLPTIQNYLNAWTSICEGTPKGGRIGSLDLASRFRWLTASKSTIIQCSPVHIGLCEKPEMVLERIFERRVL
ncbi:MAG: DUF3037 domain-containing protein [Bacteroidota bacterium]